MKIYDTLSEAIKGSAKKRLQAMISIDTECLECASQN